MVRERICNLSQDSDLMLDNGRVYMRRLGEIIHYIADYFNSKSWYKGTVNPEDFSTSVFNDYEIQNIELIQSYE